MGRKADIRRYRRALSALVLALFVLASCGKKQEAATLAESIELDENAAQEVNFEVIRENNEEYARITGISRDGQEVWTRETDVYEAAQADRVADIGISGSLYYYVEGGDIVALSRQDGSRVWKNMEFGGCPAPGAFAFDEESRLFITGYLGPHLFVTDMNGQTISRQISLGDGYSHPIALSLSEGNAVVTFEDGPAGEQGTLYVNIDSMTASATTEGERPIYVVNVRSSLKLRSGPSTSASTLAGLKSGTRLYLIAMEGEWANVEVVDTGQTGYVFAEYIQPEEP